MSEKVNIVFDMSKYDLFQLCAARYNFRHNMNIGLPGKPERLDRGSLVHVANEFYYENLMQGKGYEASASIALSKIREAGVCSTDLSNEMISRVVDVMEEYYDYWRIADQGIVINAVEQPFMYELFANDEVRLFLAGKIDLVISDNQYEHEPWDHKTYDRTYDIGRMSNQFKNYAVALESNYLTVNKIGFQKTLKPHEKFSRPRLSFDPLMLDEWKKNVINVLMNHYLTCVATGTWPLNETSCDKYNRKCEFYDICDSSGVAAKNHKINSMYVVGDPWDVTRVMKKSSQIVQEEKKKREEINAKAEQARTQIKET